LSPILHNPDWVVDAKLGAEVRRVLVPLCARYLLHAKKGVRPLDPVARFHLRNGAQLERINWLGDVSETGLQNSFGLMVNYVYRLAKIEDNHELYTQKYEIAATKEIKSLARTAEASIEARVRRLVRVVNT
jgi:malonyl-CoA decarboxylase